MQLLIMHIRILLKYNIEKKGTLQIRLTKIDRPIIADLKIPKNSGWKTISAPLVKYQQGIHNLVVQLKDNKEVEVDWINF